MYHEQTKKYLILEVNIDDSVTKLNAGSDVGLTSLRRITRKMPAEEKKVLTTIVRLLCLRSLRLHADYLCALAVPILTSIPSLQSLA